MTKRQKLQRALLGLFVLGLPVLALQALPRPGSSGAGPSGSAAGSRLPVEVVRVERTSGYDLRRAYTGEVRARRSVMTSFELGGRIEELLVDEGQRVEQGDGLARLDDRRLGSPLRFTISPVFWSRRLRIGTSSSSSSMS